LSPVAVFSPCGLYRWWLGRLWDPARPWLLFIGLNPSSADGQRDDPTLRRLVGLARGWGYGSLTVVNLFARVASRPVVLRRCDDPVGAANDLWIRHWALGDGAKGLPQRIWLGWGNGGTWRGRDREVLRLLAETSAPLAGQTPLAMIGLTQAGQPRHPLYAAAASRLVPFPHPSPGGLEARAAAPS
jgi:hypothetical protein